MRAASVPRKLLGNTLNASAFLFDEAAHDQEIRRCEQAVARATLRLAAAIRRKNEAKAREQDLCARGMRPIG